MGRIFQLIKGGQSKSRPSKPGGLIQAAKLSGKHWVEFFQRRLGSGRSLDRRRSRRQHGGYNHNENSNRESHSHHDRATFWPRLRSARHSIG
jgi:hypothetical protein